MAMGVKGETALLQTGDAEKCKVKGSCTLGIIIKKRGAQLVVPYGKKPLRRS